MSQSSIAASVRQLYDRDGYYIFRKMLSVGAIASLHEYLAREIYPHDTPLLRHPSVKLEAACPSNRL